MTSWNKGKTEVFDAFADVLKATANGRRLELLELLAQGEHSVDVLSRMSGIALTTVSANLQVLKQSGLVTTRRQGTTVFYRLSGEDVAALYVLAKRVGMAHSAPLRDAVTSYMSAINVECTDGAQPRVSLTNDMTVVDVRPRAEFDEGHLEGAISMPIDELPQRYGELPRERPIAVYCRGEFCRLAREAAQWLCSHGLPAMAMDEGVVEWRVTGEVEVRDAA